MIPIDFKDSRVDIGEIGLLGSVVLSAHSLTPKPTPYSAHGMLFESKQAYDK